MKRLVMTLILTCALSSTAFAGDIPSDGTASHAPSSSPQTATPTVPGELPMVGPSQRSEGALSLLLALFGWLS